MIDGYIACGMALIISATILGMFIESGLKCIANKIQELVDSIKGKGEVNFIDSSPKENDSQYSTSFFKKTTKKRFIGPKKSKRWRSDK